MGHRKDQQKCRPCSTAQARVAGSAVTHPVEAAGGSISGSIPDLLNQVPLTQSPVFQYIQVESTQPRRTGRTESESDQGRELAHAAKAARVSCLQ